MRAMIFLAAMAALVISGTARGAEEWGIELTFGNAEALCQIAELTGRAEGFGQEIGMGSKRLCDKYGHPELSMTVKGQEFPAYDPRAIQGMGLTYATSNRGACHLRSYTVSSEILGVPEWLTDPRFATRRGWAEHTEDVIREERQDKCGRACGDSQPQRQHFLSGIRLLLQLGQ